MTPIEALGWGVLGLIGGALMGQLSLLLERPLKNDDSPPRLGPGRLELVLLPALGFIGFFAFALRQGIGPGLLVHSLWMVVLLQILGFDLKHRLILDVITLPTMALALLLANLSPDLSVVRALFGILLGGVLMLPFAVASEIFHNGEGFGWGDVKLAMMIGAITGMSLNYGQLYALWALIAGSVIGGVITILLLVTRRVSLRDALPYGPYLVAGAGLILYFM
ncbi:MAG TPA: A24 family peptidase [Candidatus Dormibacteraeota bacterium]|nr:A24 family peptidase [Candidatus Dormibacteraeota bacterium]